ncbi:MAG: hypothetical protein GXC78_03985 [Chitinophagaceae bacterium]|nr:hypothetical protein [Chitinophagaceae bacterium]
MSFIRNIKQLSAGLVAGMACPLLAIAQQATPGGYSQSAPINFVRTWDAVKPDTARSTWVLGASVQTARIATQYIDGLGRPLQTVLKQGSLVTGGTAADLVTAQVYDPYGRERYQYLPFVANMTGGNASLNDGLFKLNPFQQDSAFSKGQYPGETWFYGQINFENSPLSRPLEAFAPGNSWVGSSGESLEANRRSVKTKYWLNKTADSVRIWNVTNVSGSFGSYTCSGIYGAGQLQKTVTVDEHGKQVVEFKDKNGQVLLKKVQLTATADDGNGKGHVGWLCTYYMYDDQGRLRCVVQPVGVELLMANSWSTTALSNAILNEQCFRYEYDGRGRMVMKRVPGAGPVHMVYDARDRLVLTQDSVLRAGSPQKWLYTQYDELNRPVATGLWNNSSSRATHASAASSSTAYPNLSGQTYEVLTRTFYDDYSWLSLYTTGQNSVIDQSSGGTQNGNIQSASNTVWPYPQAVTPSTELKGLVTGSMVKVLGTSTNLFSVNFYDDKGRLIQTKARNITGDVDIITTQYSWSGQPLVNIVKQQKAGTNAQTSIVVTRFTYDSLMRVAKTDKKVTHTQVNAGANPSSWTTISENEYDALGQLKKKKLDPAYNSNAGLDSLTFDYNIRGWMLGMNRLYAKDVHQNNYFGFDLGYDKAQNGIINNLSYVTPQYNGNISGMVWKSKGDAEKRKYDFTYDAANRILSADFNQYTGSSFNKTAGIDFSMRMGNGVDPLSAYDANGNIKAMYEMGWMLSGSGPVDDLVYAYEANSNRLKYVFDHVYSVDSRKGDFKEATANYNSNTTLGTADYAYDGNGNLVKDLNKDIVTYGGANGIEYNYLNLPQKITVKKDASNNKGTIEYTYDAAGNKLRKTVYEPGVDTTVTLYIAGNVYRNDTLEFIGYEEGRIRKKGTTALVYDYMLKDHLGNVRMLLTTQRDTSFYPVASLETASLATERNYYGGVDTGRVNKSTVSGYPSDTYTSPNDFIQKLNGAGPKIGTNMVLKVMAGDKVNLFAKSWYKKNGVTPGTPNNPLTNILNVLEPAIGGITGTHGGATLTELQTTSVLDNQVTSFLNSQSGYTTSKPKAFVNWVLFDEQFKYVAASSGFEQVGADNTLTTHTPAAINISKGGYLYIYLSNETPNIDVFFDNLQVTHIRGPILEETHYYPFGLTMAGISGKALAFGGSENKKEKFNGAELNTDFDLNTYEFQLRTYDPQIGRWHGLDTKPTDMVSLYAAMANNPIRYADPLGDTLALFRPDGTFWKFQDDGKKEFSGMFYQKSAVTSTYEKDGVNYEVVTYSDGLAFQFNDPAVDVLAIKNGVESGGKVGITHIELMSDSKLESQIDRSGVKSPEAQAGPVGYANKSGRQGTMDYGVQGIRAGDLNPKAFYIREGTAYNVGDIGNYLWGRGMAELGIRLSTASIGAHINNMANGRKDQTPLYDFGPGTYGKPGVFDSQGDQRAIHRGYANSPKGAMLLKQELQNWPKYNPK